MYLEYFNFTELPFALTPNVDFYCQLRSHQEAFNILLFSLRSGEGFIKIIGEVGSGKTLLCRKLLNSLSESFFTAYIPNPHLKPSELRKAFARELGINPEYLNDQHELLSIINNRLIELNSLGKRVVLLVDEAQAMSIKTLEALRLLTNLETEKTKLLQVVLFGQPELDEHLSQPAIRQFKQRITSSYYLSVMTREELDIYLFHRLAIAGHNVEALFSKKARNFIYRSSGGVPRLVNILCHKALLIAYGRGERMITQDMIWYAVKDTEAAKPFHTISPLIFLAIGISLMMSLILLFFY